MGRLFILKTYIIQLKKLILQILVVDIMLPQLLQLEIQVQLMIGELLRLEQGKIHDG